MFERQKHRELILSIRLEMSREGSSKFVLALFQDRRKDKNLQNRSVDQKGIGVILDALQGVTH